MKWRNLPHLRTGDLVLVRRKPVGHWWDWWLSWAIRVCSTRPGEEPTVVQHVAGVIRRPWAEVNGPGGRELHLVDDWVISEALGDKGYIETRLRERYDNTDKFSVAIVRRTDMPRGALPKYRKAHRHLLGKKYGKLKIAAHAADYALTWVKYWAHGGPEDVYLFRRMCRMDRYPMCSWSELYKADKAGFPWRVPVSKGTPDDMWDESLERVADGTAELVFFTDDLEEMLG